MDGEKLRIFMAVASCGSISEVARRLYISRSTVSRAVAALENELDAELFVRSNRDCALSPAGEALRKEAEMIIAAMEKAARKVKEAAGK